MSALTFERHFRLYGARFARDNVIGAALAGPFVGLFCEQLNGRAQLSAAGWAVGMLAGWLLAFGFLWLGHLHDRRHATAQARWQGRRHTLDTTPLQELARACQGPVRLRGKVVAVDLMLDDAGESCVATFVRAPEHVQRKLRSESGVALLESRRLKERGRFVPFELDDGTGRVRVEASTLTFVESTPSDDVKVSLRRADELELTGRLEHTADGKRLRGDVLVSYRS